MPSLPYRIALLQTVRACRYRQAIRVHAADSRAHRQKRRQERLHVLRISHDRGERHFTSDLRQRHSGADQPRTSERRAQGIRRSLQEVTASNRAVLPISLSIWIRFVNLFAAGGGSFFFVGGGDGGGW